MAIKRMSSGEIITSNEFVDMSSVSQALYQQMLHHADDDGVVCNSKTLVPLYSDGRKALRSMLKAGFLLGFDNDIYVITHWLCHNSIQRLKYKPSRYMEIREHLFVRIDGTYTLDENKGIPIDVYLVHRWIKYTRKRQQEIEEEGLPKGQSQGQPQGSPSIESVLVVEQSSPVQSRVSSSISSSVLNPPTKADGTTKDRSMNHKGYPKVFNLSDYKGMVDKASLKWDGEFEAWLTSISSKVSNKALYGIVKYVTDYYIANMDTIAHPMKYFKKSIRDKITELKNSKKEYEQLSLPFDDVEVNTEEKKPDRFRSCLEESIRHSSSDEVTILWPANLSNDENTKTWTDEFICKLAQSYFPNKKFVGVQREMEKLS